jgi:hypothetical protein
MRIKDYFNAGILFKRLYKIRNECSEILNIYQRTYPDCLYRASDDRFDFKAKTPRMDREPRDTEYDIHEVLNDAFNEIFGWNVRSEGVFTSSSFQYISSFGDNKYVIFPTNGFKYVYNKTGNDNIYPFIRNVSSMAGFFSDEEVIDGLKRLIKHEYTDKNLENVIKKSSYVEVVIKCNKYYALYVDQNNLQFLANFLETM